MKTALRILVIGAFGTATGYWALFGWVCWDWPLSTGCRLPFHAGRITNDGTIYQQHYGKSLPDRRTRGKISKAQLTELKKFIVDHDFRFERSLISGATDMPGDEFSKIWQAVGVKEIRNSRAKASSNFCEY